jgi:hypothetical protein
MGKLVKTLVILGLLVAGVVVAMRYTGDSGDSDPKTKQTESQPPMQPQERYGFAPMGEE